MPRFRNREDHPLQDLPGFLRWRWGSWRRRPRPKSLPRADNDPEFLAQNSTRTTLTWIGHSTFLVQIGGLNVLTDPHFTERASSLAGIGPRRLVPPGLELDDIPPLDAILISHNHYDHLDRDSLRSIAARHTDTACFVPTGLGGRLRRWGFERVHEMAWWSRDELGETTVTAVPVKHSSVRLGLDRNRTQWSGWVLQHSGFRLLFAGDTAYSSDFGEIRRRLGPMDLSLLPIGAYEPRWFMRHVHATPEEAVQIHLDLESRRSVAMHWGTFILTDEPVEEPPRRLAHARRAAGLEEDEFLVLRHGATLRFD